MTHEHPIAQPIVDLAFDPDAGLATCQSCGDTAPFLVVPNWVTGEPVRMAARDWPRPDCPVDAGQPCPFLLNGDR